MSNSYINRNIYILVILIIISNKVNSKKRGETKMKCKKCKGELNKEQTKENNPESLCAFCDGSILQRIIEVEQK